MQVSRGRGRVILSATLPGTAGEFTDELTPAEARSLARRLTSVARDVERQVPTAGDGWELAELK
ncbi:hypothetical protein [Streptomyces sp. DH12]|uniref:hypothetical protein n=1 Tax=Streptomyces sp. DH12 TaxID=2857010 RepID=UPI001E45F261|nr:hypothetical protein [Streptomyces sp. DH12]